MVVLVVLPTPVELWGSVSDYRVLGHLPDHGPSPPIVQFGRVASSGRVLVVPNFFHLRIMEASVFLRTFNAGDIFWYPSPDLCLDTILSRSSKDNSFNLLAWFFSDMHCQLWDLIEKGVCLSKPCLID